MSTVYVTQQPRRNRHNWTPNLEPAAKYGPLKFVFEGDDHPFENPRSAIVKAANELAFFDWKNDYILWPNTGDPAAMWAIMIALSEILLEEAESIQFLYWERKLIKGVSSRTEGYYVPIRFPLNVAAKIPLPQFHRA
jgi:hypothetical protein